MFLYGRSTERAFDLECNASLRCVVADGAKSPLEREVSAQLELVLSEVLSLPKHRPKDGVLLLTNATNQTNSTN